MILELICDGILSEIFFNSDFCLLMFIIFKGFLCFEVEELFGDMGDVVGLGDNRDFEVNVIWEGRSFIGEIVVDLVVEVGFVGFLLEFDLFSYWFFGFLGELIDLKYFWDFVMKVRERMDKKEVNMRGEVEKMVILNNRGRI